MIYIIITVFYLTIGHLFALLALSIAKKERPQAHLSLKMRIFISIFWLPDLSFAFIRGVWIGLANVINNNQQYDADHTKLKEP